MPRVSLPALVVAASFLVAPWSAAQTTDCRRTAMGGLDCYDSGSRQFIDVSPTQGGGVFIQRYGAPSSPSGSDLIQEGIRNLGRALEVEAERDRMREAHRLEMQRIERAHQLRMEESRRSEQSNRARAPSGLSAEATRVDAAHPGWQQIVRTQDFKDWLTLQQPPIQRLTASQRADDAILLLDLYKGSFQR